MVHAMSLDKDPTAVVASLREKCRGDIHTMGREKCRTGVGINESSLAWTGILRECVECCSEWTAPKGLSLIHISEPTRLDVI
eukprot:1422227-Prorocentrum_lima.AAC.1